jgi:iron complex outermembrane receptor protein
MGYKHRRQFTRTKLATMLLVPVTQMLAPTATFAENSVLTLEEVVVTARKREESLQDIPVAATVFGAAALEMRGVSDVADITHSVPNLSYQDRAGGHQTSIGIRGISSNVRNIGLEDSVGIYVDGVYIGRPMFYNIDLADVAQIEVLRGPQGTLFGKNTIAGALNITTKGVSEELEGKVSASLGNYGLQHIKGSVSGKFSDQVGGSLSFTHKQTDGYIDNLFNGDELQAVDQYGVAGKLEFNPSDSLRVLVAADYSEKDNDVVASQILTPSGLGAGEAFAGQSDPFEVNEDGPQIYQEEVKGLAVTVDYDLENNYSLTAIGAWRQMDLYATFDDDNLPADILNSYFTDEAEQQSLELRLTSPGDGDFSWILGVFYYDQEVESSRLTQAFGATVNITGDGNVESQSTAVYFSGDYHMTENLDLNVGLRYTRDEKEAVWSQVGGAFGFPTLVQSGDETFSEVSPTIALTYALNEDATVYGKVSRGFKSGGFMTDLIGNDGFVLDPETVTNYELGLKSKLLDGRLHLNAAVFSMDYEDLQTIDLNGLQFVGANAAEATLQGIELDFQFRASEGLLLSGGVGYTDSKYDKFLQNVSGTVQDHSGNALRNAPEVTANLVAEYRYPIADTGELVLVGEWSYKDDTYYDVTNDPLITGSSYSLLNGRIGYTSADEHWSLFLWGRNLADKEYFTFLRDGPFSEWTGLYGEPRTFGVDLTLNF